MIIYLVKRYFLIASIVAAVALAMMFLVTGIDNLLLKSFLNLFVSGALAVYFTHRHFERQNLWVMYYNLRLSKSALLGSCLLLFEVILVSGVTLILWGLGFDLRLY